MPNGHVLKAMEFTRYRAFEQPQRLELKPITLLFGHNSVGKSAALRLLPILASACQPSRSSGGSAVLDYSAPALRQALFSDLIHNGQVSSGLQLGLHWEDLGYDFTLRDLGSDGEVLSELNITMGGKHLAGGPAKSGSRNDIEFVVDGAASHWRFSGLRPVSTDTQAAEFAAHALRERLDEFSTSVRWLGAVRAAVPRFFEMNPGTDPQIRQDGSGVAEAMRASASAGDGAAEAVSAWLRSTCDCSLSFASSDEALLYNRRFYPFDVITGSDRRVAVRDVGEGIAQALPVVMLCHQARLGQLGRNPILAFEQPELHLHPSAAVKLADEIISCIAEGSSALHVVETHAESMLLSVQIAIVEGRVRPEDVMVYWIAPGSAGATLRPVTFDASGFAVGGWPQGVFRETLEQARRLSQLRAAPVPA